MNVLVPLLAFVCAGGAVYLLVLGLWPHRFLEEAKQQMVEREEANVIAASRNVVLNRLGRVNARFMTQSQYDRFQKAYTSAGAPGTLTAPEFVGLMELSALGFGLFGYLLLDAVELNQSLMPTFIAFGAFLPVIWLRDMVKRRHFEITRALPYDLDLLTLAVEAGLDFTGALAKVVELGKPGSLREELAITLNEMKMGKTREEALTNLAARVDLAPLSTFVANLVQADRMGTPLGKVLRIQSSQMRVERTQRAEKLANEAPVKMLFPLIFCIFPTVFMVLFGPIVYQFIFGKM